MPLTQQQVTELTELLHDLDEIRSVTYSSESTVDGSPAGFKIKPDPTVSETRLEEIAVRAVKVIEQYIDAEIKVSLEHPMEPVINSNMELINHVPTRTQYLISIRWNEQMAGTPSDVRLFGRAITDGLPSE